MNFLLNVYIIFIWTELKMKRKIINLFSFSAQTMAPNQNQHELPASLTLGASPCSEQLQRDDDNAFVLSDELAQLAAQELAENDEVSKWN